MSNKTKQKELYYLGYYNYKIDGIFGIRSKKATRLFQEDYSLKIDGIFGKKTIKKMFEVWKNIQVKLNAINKSNLKIDGLVGPKTIEQIEMFQKNSNISKTGICDKKTINLLDEEKNSHFIKPKFPLNYIRITQRYKAGDHNGVDFGINKTINEPYPLIYAPLDMQIVTNTTGSDAGNYVVGVSDYNDEYDMLFRFLHLKEKPSISVGSIIKQGESFARMGSTGRSTGTHLHFEVWLTPKNYRYNFSERYSYLKNPLEYIYIYPNQVVSKNTTYNLLYF